MKIKDLIAKIQKEQEECKHQLEERDGLERLQEVAEKYEGEYKLIWSDDLIEQIKNAPQQTKYFTGIEKLDGVVGGFRPQQLITLAAHTKHGKTNFGLFLINNLTKLNPVVLSLEQSAEELVWQRHENGYSVPTFLTPHRLAPEVTVDWIEYRVIEGVAKYDTKMIVIDNLDFIDKGKGSENIAYKVGEVMRGLKSIAQRWNVIILLQAHINQAEETNPPVLKDIKNSSDIAQNSDMVMMLWRENYTQQKEKVYTNNTLISIQANRRTGKNENIKFTFNSQTGDYEHENWTSHMEEEAQKALNAF